MHFKKNVSRDYNNRIIRTCFLKLCVDFFLDILTFLELYEEKRSTTITTHFFLSRGALILFCRNVPHAGHLTLASSCC